MTRGDKARAARTDVEVSIAWTGTDGSVWAGEFPLRFSVSWYVPPSHATAGVASFDCLVLSEKKRVITNLASSRSRNLSSGVFFSTQVLHRRHCPKGNGMDQILHTSSTEPNPRSSNDEGSSADWEEVDALVANAAADTDASDAPNRRQKHDSAKAIEPASPSKARQERIRRPRTTSVDLEPRKESEEEEGQKQALGLLLSAADGESTAQPRCRASSGSLEHSDDSIGGIEPKRPSLQVKVHRSRDSVKEEEPTSITNRSPSTPQSRRPPSQTQRAARASSRHRAEHSRQEKDAYEALTTKDVTSHAVTSPSDRVARPRTSAVAKLEISTVMDRKVSVDSELLERIESPVERSRVGPSKTRDSPPRSKSPVEAVQQEAITITRSRTLGMHDPPKQANGSREKHDFGRPESPIQSKPTERSGMTRSGSPIEIDQRVARSRTRDAANRPEFPVERLPRTASSRTRTVPKPSTGQDKPSHSDDAVELTRLGDYARKPEARKRPESLVEVAGSDHPPRRMIPQSQDISSVSRRRDRSQSRPTSPLEHHCMDRGEGERKHSADHDARDGPIARKNSSDAEVPRRRPSQTRQHGARGEDEMLPRSRSQRRFGDRSRERGNEETRESPVMRDARSRERERYHLTEEEQSQRRDRVMSPSRREVPRPDRPARSPHRQHSAPDDHRHHRGQSKSRDRKRIETPEPISAHHQRLLSPRRDHKRNSSYTLDKDDGFDANVGTQSDTGRYRERQNRSRPTTPSSPEPEYHSRRKDRMLSPGPSRERHYAPTPSPSRHHGRAESNGRGRRDADDRRESPRRDRSRNGNGPSRNPSTGRSRDLEPIPYSDDYGQMFERKF